MLLLVKLLLAHLLGDFVLQPASWVIEKEQKKLRSWQFHVHLLLHGGLILILTWNLNLWPQALTLMLAHGIIDAVKVHFQTMKTKRAWFFIDQGLHLLTIVAIGVFWNPATLGISYVDANGLLLLATGFIFLTNPTSIIIKLLISHWAPDTAAPQNGSLVDAGKYVGIIERFLIVVFILANSWEAIGFLLGAKSVFRFGDLRGNERKLTEYVLIGTLLSFAAAIVVGLILHAARVNEHGQLRPLLHF